MLTKDFLKLRAYARRSSRRLEVQGRTNFSSTAYVLRDPHKSGPEVYCTSHDDAVAIQCLLAHAEAMHQRIHRRATNTGISLPPRTVKRRSRRRSKLTGIKLRGLL